jgi:hypothetical protein
MLLLSSSFFSKNKNGKKGEKVDFLPGDGLHGLHVKALGLHQIIVVKFPIFVVK